MNKLRRQQLLSIINDLRSVQDSGDLYSCINELDNIKYDEQYYYDNIPENLQNSQRADDSAQAIDNLEDALNLLNQAYDTNQLGKNSKLILQAVDKIEEARW